MNTDPYATPAAQTPAPAFRACTSLEPRHYAHCAGAHHSDSGELKTHDLCGADVVQREDGRIWDVIRTGFHQARKFACWTPSHQCDPAMVEAHNRERAMKLAAGELVKGCRAEVFKGRKVPKGTTGVVIWMGEGQYGARVGLKDDAGTTHWTAATNVRPV